MRSREKLERLTIELLHELYMASEPPLNFKGMVADLKSKNPLRRWAAKWKCRKQWYLRHRLSEEDTLRIEKEFKRKHKLTEYEMSRFSTDLLNYAPTFEEAKGDLK